MSLEFELPYETERWADADSVDGDNFELDDDGAKEDDDHA